MSEHGWDPSRSDAGGERSRAGPLPDYYGTVALDILRLCRRSGDGVWVDPGSGAGPVALALAECSGGRIVLVDANTEALAEAGKKVIAKEDGARIERVCGRAEAMPLAGRSVDLVVSRGSIFFWDDQASVLAEVYRVLGKGGQAMIGGGLGRDYPQWARQEFIRRRHEGVRSKGPEAYERFLRLREPQTSAEWAREAGLPHFEVVGEGGKPADDPRAGLGIWLRLER